MEIRLRVAIADVTRRKRRHLREHDAVAMTVAAYKSVYGKPLRGRTKLAALLAAYKYLNPDGSVREKPLPFNIYVTLAPDGSIRTNIDSVVDDAVDKGLVRLYSEECVEGCDEPGVTYIYEPGANIQKLIKRNPDAYRDIRSLVEKLGALSAKEIIERIAEKIGLKGILAHHGFVEL